MRSLQQLIKQWDHFFFMPQPTEGMALFRIIWCAFLGVSFLIQIANIDYFYGPHALLSFQTTQDQIPFQLNILKLFQQSYSGVYAFFFLYGLSLLTSLLGLFTRSSLMILFICMTSLDQRNIGIVGDADQLMRMMTFYLILSPCGHCLSFDRLIGRIHPGFSRPKKWPLWSLRLIQIQLSWLYLGPFFLKLIAEILYPDWAIFYGTPHKNPALLSLSQALDHKLGLAYLSWITLCVDLLVGILVWTRKWRRSAILLGLCFQLFIVYMTETPFWGVGMILLLLNFFTPQEFKRFVHQLRPLIFLRFKKSSLSRRGEEEMIQSIRG